MKLLTIAIPTYKRPLVLIQCIESIIFHLNNADLSKIAILISDNDPDSTFHELLLKSQFPSNLQIQYVKNSSNIGAELNFIQCARLAENSRYLWILGDDDFTVPGLMRHLIMKLEESAPDIVFVECRPKFWEIFASDESVTTSDKGLFLSYVNYHITFVSAFILPLTAVKRHLGRGEGLVGSLIPHLGWVFPSLMDSKTQLLVPKRSLVGGKEGTGGYRFGQVFVKNFWQLWRTYTQTSPQSQSIEDASRLCRKLMLLVFYPSVLLAKKRSSAKFKFDDEKLPEIFHEEFGNDPLYAFTVDPFIRRTSTWALAIFRFILLLVAMPTIARLGWKIRKVRRSSTKVWSIAAISQNQRKD